ncbi:MAG: lactonase family protein [Sphaerochaeta sp.]|nr:lactonase family protein [Sphaerochaeta sp.]
MATKYLIVGSRVPSTEAGLSLYSFDEGTGQLSLLKSHYGIDMPTFQAFNKEASLLYSVSEIREKEGSVQTFRFDPHASDPFTLVSTVLSGGNSPCHLALSPNREFLALSNYGDGVFTLYALDPTGNIASVAYYKKFSGVGFIKNRQEASHIHSALWTSDSKNLFVADLGLDRIVHYSKPEWSFPSFKKVPLGTGPRHMALSTGSRYLYIAGELSNHVIAYRIDKFDSCFTHLQSIATIPSGFHFANTVADLHLSSDNKYLYCSNRGHDSIITYAVNSETGMLTFVAYTPTLGQEPRNFTLSADDKWLLVANASSDSIAVFPIDPYSGVPGKAVSMTSVKEPVCLSFA